MKLLQINTCITQSTGRIAQQIGEKVIANGWESYIAFPARVPMVESKSHLLHIGSKFDQYFHALMTRIFDCCGFLSRRATKRLIRQIEEIKPNVIQLHNIHGYFINVPILFDYLKKSGIPVVWTLHDCWAFTGHCVHYTCIDCFKWKTGCSYCPRKNSYPNSYVFDRSKQNYKAKKKAYANMPNLTIVPVSYWLGVVTNQSMLGNYPIKVIQNGIDVNVFRPRTDAIEGVREKYGLMDKYVILGVATGWSEEVGLSTFFRIRKKLSSDFAIVMVGCTPEILKQLPEGIVGISRTNNVDELAEIYTAADILFNGSYQETFGLVTAEALSCGTPVIVYNSTACPEIVTSETGYIAEAKDEMQVLKYILEDSSLSADVKEERIAKCRKYALEHFDKEKKYQEYLNLYESIIQ